MALRLVPGVAAVVQIEPGWLAGYGVERDLDSPAPGAEEGHLLEGRELRRVEKLARTGKPSASENFRMTDPSLSVPNPGSLSMKANSRAAPARGR
ncbi:MAG: hypothetical protein R3D03_14490 [Geminicoccaceae bacterium]